MRQKTSSDGAVTFRQTPTIPLVASAMLWLGIAFFLVAFLSGGIPASGLILPFLMLAIGAPFFGVLWSASAKSWLRVSAETVTWLEGGVDVADIESVRIVAEPIRVGALEGEQSFLVFALRDGQEVQCRAISRRMGDVDERKLLGVKEEIEKQVASISEKRGRRDSGE